MPACALSHARYPWGWTRARVIFEVTCRRCNGRNGPEPHERESGSEKERVGVAEGGGSLEEADRLFDVDALHAPDGWPSSLGFRVRAYGLRV